MNFFKTLLVISFSTLLFSSYAQIRIGVNVQGGVINNSFYINQFKPETDSNQISHTRGWSIALEASYVLKRTQSFGLELAYGQDHIYFDYQPSNNYKIISALRPNAQIFVFWQYHYHKRQRYFGSLMIGPKLFITPVGNPSAKIGDVNGEFTRDVPYGVSTLMLGMTFKASYNIVNVKLTNRSRFYLPIGICTDFNIIEGSTRIFGGIHAGFVFEI